MRVFQKKADERLRLFYPASLLLVLVILLNACSTEKTDFSRIESDKPLAQILDDLEFAITERNFRINNRLHIGKAISERVSSGFPDYEVILFCNLSHAQKMLELAPEFISYCPHRLAIRDTGNTRIITASLLPEDTSNAELNRVTGKVNDLVREMLEFAAEEWPEVEE